ncbi:MAG: hypothetical protein AB3N10_02335 [Allomuricauda sp.]
MVFILLLTPNLSAQVESGTPATLVAYIKTLEEKFAIKFSYIHEDL